MIADKVKLYDLAPSPNNMKVRIALNYKGIPFEKVEVNPQDRSEVIRISGQPLTPMMVHGDRVIWDSAAILRYLEGNFRETPPIFSKDYNTIKEIERWETLGKVEFGKPVSMTFRQAFAEKKDLTECERASRLLDELTAPLEDHLATGSWLVGDGITAADMTVAPMVHCGMLPPAAAQAGPIGKFFSAHLKLASGRDKTRAWVSRVMAYDR